MGPVAGLAAGLGLAALASHLGFSDELASILLIALLAVAAVFVVRMLMSRRETARAPLPYAGAGAGLGTTPGGYETQVPPPTRFEPVFGGAARSARAALPPDFDAPAFAREAKQAVPRRPGRRTTATIAKSLADVMTPELLREIVREMESSGAARPTEIVDVDAEVVDVATEESKHWVSVRFTGTAREDGALEPFDEVWNLVKPVDGSSGWLHRGDPAASHAFVRMPGGASPEALAARRGQPGAAGETWARDQLAAHAGAVFTLTFGPFAASFRIGDDGTFAPAPARRGRDPSPYRLAAGPAGAVGRASRAGARTCATTAIRRSPATLEAIAQTFPWFVERAFARVLGPIAGQALADTGRALLAIPAALSHHAAQSVGQYAGEADVVAQRGDFAALSCGTRRGAGARRRARRAHRRAANPSASPAGARRR